MFKAPAPVTSPLAQRNDPFTVRLPFPASVLVEATICNLPFVLIVLDPLKVKVARSKRIVCKPAPPPSNRPATVGLNWSMVTV